MKSPRGRNQNFSKGSADIDWDEDILDGALEALKELEEEKKQGGKENIKTMTNSQNESENSRKTPTIDQLLNQLREGLRKAGISVPVRKRHSQPTDEYTVTFTPSQKESKRDSKDLRDNLILLKDGTLVDIRPNSDGKPALEYKDGKWEVYSGDSAELFLGRDLTDSEIRDLISKGIIRL